MTLGRGTASKRQRNSREDEHMSTQDCRMGDEREYLLPDVVCFIHKY